MKVKIKKELLDYIKNSALHSEFERGGILIGYETDDESIITHIIEDEQSQDRSSTHFTRFTENIWFKLQEIVKNSEKSDYIGEWHTHPMLFNSPSILDDCSIRDIIESSFYSYISKVVLCISTGITTNFWIYDNEQRVNVKVSILL